MYRAVGGLLRYGRSERYLRHIVEQRWNVLERFIVEQRWNHVERRWNVRRLIDEQFIDQRDGRDVWGWKSRQ